MCVKTDRGHVAIIGGFIMEKAWRVFCFEEKVKGVGLFSCVRNAIIGFS